MRLIDVYRDPAAVRILYDLLGKRSHSISHTERPSFRKHASFVRSKPYRAWYLIKESDYVGAIYLTDRNEIGLSVTPWNRRTAQDAIADVMLKHKPLPSVPSKRTANYGFHVSPKNAPLIALLKTMGAKHIQSTFTL